MLIPETDYLFQIFDTSYVLTYAHEHTIEISEYFKTNMSHLCVKTKFSNDQMSGCLEQLSIN